MLWAAGRRRSQASAAPARSVPADPEETLDGQGWVPGTGRRLKGPSWCAWWARAELPSFGRSLGASKASITWSAKAEGGRPAACIALGGSGGMEATGDRLPGQIKLVRATVNDRPWRTTSVPSDGLDAQATLPGAVRFSETWQFSARRRVDGAHRAGHQRAVAAPQPQIDGWSLIGCPCSKNRGPGRKAPQPFTIGRMIASISEFQRLPGSR